MCPPLQEATPTHEVTEKSAGLPGGGAEEAEQVNQFLEKEQQVFERANHEPSPEPEVEVRVFLITNVTRIMAYDKGLPMVKGAH